MSWQASAWAANVPHGLVGYVAFRTLSLMANDAKEDGRATWLAASTIAARLGVSERTVERGLKELRDAGMIRYGDQAHVAHLPKNRRPPVYDLTMLGRDDLLAIADGSVTVELELPESGPSKLSAQNGAESGPSKLSAPTAVVAVSMEEPSVKTLTTQRNQQTARARGVERAECAKGHPVIAGTRSCSFGHYGVGLTSPDDERLPASEAVALAAARGGAA